MFAVVIGAGPWYSSEVFWSVLGVMAALGVGIPTFLVTWVPRQRLYYWALPPTSLLASGTRSIAELEIRHEGRQLADPYLLEVVLTARGRRDISSSAFDQGRPLVFDLSAGIVKVLQVRVQPSSSLSPPVAHEGSTLRVGPELIGCRQTITISVLLDGSYSRLVCTQPVLTQVTVIRQEPPDRSSAEAPFLRLLLAIAAGVLGASVPGLIGAGAIPVLIGTFLAALFTVTLINMAFFDRNQRFQRTTVAVLLLAVTAIVLTIGGFTITKQRGEVTTKQRGEVTVGELGPGYIFAPETVIKRGSLWLQDGQWGDVESQVVGDKSLAGQDFGYWRQGDGKRVVAATSGGKLAPTFQLSQPDISRCREILDDSAESSHELDGYPSGSWFCAMTSASNIAALQVFIDPSSGEDKIVVIYIVWNP